ncbi:M35 family metallo-endopeptidase [Pseudoroseicyclus tamaricis]|uniref:Protease n=1 Tax=Pseudoroseicyclus tamaricis TaxID=2705421 RepID=A0A6B2JIP8_9RHOB|nr:M35 family metallo-endopeptidase [Pseudoroseicyclus tamaricis]NDV01273.1 protease [Pseudoroseicyclus tamaricis]
MLLRSLFSAVLLLLPITAQAATFERCGKTEIAVASAALRGAGDIVLSAAATVSDSDAYRRWFGRYDSLRAETVRRNLKAINRALISDEMAVVCPAFGEDGCLRDTYANVYPDEPYIINLCPAFFRQPNMHAHPPGAPELEFGTREGTIIHEMSHFRVVADTEDLCYSRSDCSAMAERDPAGAIRNADSYQYFAEDVTFYPLPAEDMEALEDTALEDPATPLDRTLPPRSFSTGPGEACLTCRLSPAIDE